MKPIIYISGPMTGSSLMYMAAFQEAAENLEARGWIVLSPHILPSILPREKILPICLSMLEQADAIYFLPYWDDSCNSQAEYYYAAAKGIRQFYYNNYPSAEELRAKL